jgi:hypothetical protein
MSEVFESDPKTSIKDASIILTEDAFEKLALESPIVRGQFNQIMELFSMCAFDGIVLRILTGDKYNDCDYYANFHPPIFPYELEQLFELAKPGMINEMYASYKLLNDPECMELYAKVKESSFSGSSEHAGAILKKFMVTPSYEILGLPITHDQYIDVILKKIQKAHEEGEMSEKEYTDGSY